jgi:hypothetical protein
MVDKSELYRKIREDADYIRCPKCGNSLSKFLSRNPDGIENSAIARLLMVTESEVDKLYNDAVRMLRAGMRDE